MVVLFLVLVSGICWTMVYVESISIGLREKTYAIPFFALALNVAWEGMESYIDLSADFQNIQTWVNVSWFFLDLILVYTYLKYGKEEFSKYCNKKHFIPVSVFIFVMSFVIQYSFRVEFGIIGAWYSAFLQNLIMSVLYINMFIARKGNKGQSISIAVNKWIGTLAPTILFGIIRGNQLVLVLGILCSVFDIAYIYYLNSYKKNAVKEQGIV